jgi:hypothetical protein
MFTSAVEARMPSNPPPWSSAEITERSLLQSVVEVARSVFGAAAASVFLLDEDTGELVFEAVAGEGLAGWVAMSGEAMLVDDVTTSAQFARDAAESTGYVPNSIMAAPLLRHGECIGVLEVLDRGTRPRGDLSDVDLIGMLATEVALGLELLVQLRRRSGQEVRRPGSESDLDILRRVGERLPYARDPVASTVSRLLATADDLLASEGSDTPGVSRRPLRAANHPGGPSVRPTVRSAFRPTVRPAFRPTVRPAFRPTVLPCLSPGSSTGKATYSTCGTRHDQPARPPRPTSQTRRTRLHCRQSCWSADSPTASWTWSPSCWPEWASR